MADGDLISRASLLAGIAELKESPWYNFGKVDGTSLELMEGMWHYGYLQRKEAVEIIEDMCIKKEPAQSVHQGAWLCNTHTEVFPWKCSKCNYDTVARFNYCPNCGTKMGGDNDGKD